MPIGFDKEAVKKNASTNKKATSGDEQDSMKKSNPAGGQKKSLDFKSKKAESTNDSAETDFDDDDDFETPEQKKDKTIIYVAVAAILVIVVFVAISYYNKNNTPELEDAAPEEVEDQVSADDEEEYIYDEDGNPIYSAETNELVDDHAIDPGAPDYENSSKSHTTAQVFDTDDYLKDINGVSISATYNVVSRDYVYDYVSYTAKRGIIDDGMEIYWLEAEYEGKQYRIQVPFYYFKDFSEQGVCRVQIEVLNIEGGGKVISYMQVVGDNT